MDLSETKELIMLKSTNGKVMMSQPKLIELNENKN